MSVIEMSMLKVLQGGTVMLEGETPMFGGDSCADAGTLNARMQSVTSRHGKTSLRKVTPLTVEISRMHPKYKKLSVRYPLDFP